MDMKESASYICKKLLENGCMIHRYDAYSTDSIYIKVDAGVACSIRISDHNGKKHLSYRYNYMANEPGNKVTMKKDKYERYYYQSGAVDKLIKDVLKLRMGRMNCYKNYDGLIQKSIQEGKEKPGFWQQAYSVKPILTSAG